VNSLELKGSQILTYCCYAYEAQKTFVAFHLIFPMLQKLLNLVHEWGRYGVFGAKGI